jgi:RimJ/RimL family protein N-acetyltransferase
VETARLILRPWSEADAALLACLAADPRVVRYVGDGQPWSEQRSYETSARLVEHWRAHGFGWRMAIDKSSGREIGLIALNYMGDGTAGLAAGQFEVGWWLAPEAWGRGFAVEGALAAIDEAFGRLGAPSAVARIQPANLRSARVAERLGMAPEFDTTGRFCETVRIYRALPSADDGCG